MAKICKEENCNNPVFSHGYCAYHNKIHYPYIIKKKLYKIARFTPKRQEQVKEYNTMIKAKDDDGKPHYCFFCTKRIWGTISHHHLEGREEDKLLDDGLLVDSHNGCHVFKFHSWSVHKLKLELWWDGFLIRLKDKSEIAYDKVMEKFNK